MASLKQTINAFNRVVASISIAQLLKDEPLNTGFFVGTKADKDLKKWSGSVTKSELTTDLGAGDLVDKIDISLNQKTAGGASILPDSFFTAGKKFTDTPGTPTAGDQTDFKNWLELQIKKVVVDNGKKFCAVVFDDLTEFHDDPTFMMEIDSLLTSWGCVGFIPADVKTDINDAMRKDVTNLFYFKTYDNSGTFEKGVEAAALGRVIFQGVGKVDGVAKELSRITPDKPSVTTGDGGDLTATEAQEWLDDGFNLFTQTVELYNETTGIKNPKGENFTNVWVLLKVAVDLSADLAQLRHEREKLSTSIQDQGTVRAVIVNRMAKLKKGEVDPVTKVEKPGVIFDYLVTSKNLDYSLVTNQGKFGYNVAVSLLQDGESFLIGITGYKDGGSFNVEAV